MKLADFTALSFDCYGTLIDWESGMLAHLRPLAALSRRNLSDDAILEAHARHESARQREAPTRLYRDILADVHAALAAEWGVAADTQASRAYGASVAGWPAFPDSRPALIHLKRYFRLVILSNVDRESFAASNSKLGVTFDAVHTAEDVGAYKPAEKGFHAMLAALGEAGVEKVRILHVAESMFHDHEPANRLGLASCHIHRRHARPGFGATMKPQTMPSCAFRFNSMAELAETHRQECR